MSTSNRFARTVDRARELARELEASKALDNPVREALAAAAARAAELLRGAERLRRLRFRAAQGEKKEG